jgi:preprotein translocase subunit YajC
MKKMIKIAYNKLLRPYLPDKIAVYNGVAVQGKSKIFDATDVVENYKQPNVDAIENNVRSGDHVVVIGGGIGVTSTVAAHSVGTDGEITVYEASEEQAKISQNTLTLNEVDRRTTVNHTIVGSLNSLGGEMGNPVELPPSDLPPCDVLEMDCEGAEMYVLNNMTIKPNIIIVESHPRFEAKTEDVISAVENLGYQIQTKQPELESGDVLTAKYSE